MSRGFGGIGVNKSMEQLMINTTAGLNKKQEVKKPLL
jgi:hypothetical protein